MIVTIALSAVALGLAALLYGLLRSLDWAEIRAQPRGILSLGGVWGVIGGGALVGFAYGALAGLKGDAELAVWLGRAVIDGLVVACAGSFYVGFYQRREQARSRSRRTDGRQPPQEQSRQPPQEQSRQPPSEGDSPGRR